jgi:hypothetical protein
VLPGEVSKDLGGHPKPAIDRQLKAGHLRSSLRAHVHAADVKSTGRRLGKLLGDTAAVTALLDRLLRHAHVLKCGPRKWRTKVQTDLRSE